ncbi:PspC domain-containing protein [Brevibacillus sp. H7]|uniref:PspC domain-containing protein n=1 Tax=Brevibacillus sp. H7 TaxID=3349138 RepID=UPI00382B6B18
MMERRLYRSRYDKKLFGVCGGIGQFLRIDATLVRIGVIVLTIFTGIPALMYFLLALVMPKEPVWSQSHDVFDPLYGGNASTSLDDEIDRLEKRALVQEVYRLRAELAKFK